MYSTYRLVGGTLEVLRGVFLQNRAISVKNSVTSPHERFEHMRFGGYCCFCCTVNFQHGHVEYDAELAVNFLFSFFQGLNGIEFLELRFLWSWICKIWSCLLRSCRTCGVERERMGTWGILMKISCGSECQTGRS